MISKGIWMLDRDRSHRRKYAVLPHKIPRLSVTHRYEQFAYANVHRLLAFDRGHHVVSMNIAVCKCIPLELALFLCHRYFLFLPRHLILLAPNLSQFFNLGNAVLILVIQDKSEINDCSNFTWSKVNEISYDNSGYCIIFGIRNIFLVYSGRLITNSSNYFLFHLWNKRNIHCYHTILINFNILSFQKL